MSETAMIASFCIICAIMCKYFESVLREYKPLVAICACCAGFVSISGMISPICTFITDMMSNAGADDEYTIILFKAAAISIIAQLGADVCKDTHETALASVAETAGRLSLAAMSVTLLADIAQNVMEFMP